jgi:energy-coupling factor transporter transmembrane protein EcfT
MSDTGARPIAPSSKLALYLAAVISVYLLRDARMAMIAAAAFILTSFVVIARGSRPVPPARWRVVAIFIAWVFIMRVALDLVSGVPLGDPGLWLAAGRQSSRVAVLAIGVVALIAATRPRDIVNELEASRIPRAARILVMMLVQYPRVLRDRYDQVVEAQVARGAERPRTIFQRVRHGSAVLLPVMQSELNAVGERATLLHLRGLDHKSVAVAFRNAPVDRRDLFVRLAAALVVAAALTARVIS